jgi:hypothetical protein
MQTPLEKKRATYLAFYKDGIYDGMLNQKLDPKKNFSAYYKRGFADGLELLGYVKEYNLGDKNEQSLN